MNNEDVIRNKSHYMLVVWAKKKKINVYTIDLMCSSNMKIRLIEMSSAQWRPFCLGLNFVKLSTSDYIY